MGSTDESFSNTGYEPKDYFLMETYVESLTEYMTEQRVPEQRFLEDVDYHDAAIGEMLYKAYREQVFQSQRESLSVGQSSSSMSDRSGQPVGDRAKRHQDAVYWVDINLAMRERIEVLSDSIERHHYS